MDALAAFIKIVPLCIFQGISIGIVCLSIGGSIAIGKASDVEFSKESIRVERQASANQSELENALEVIELYQNSIETVRTKAKTLSRRDKRVKQLVEDIELVEKSVPESKVERIQDTLKQSKELLENERQEPPNRNTEDK